MNKKERFPFSDRISTYSEGVWAGIIIGFTIGVIVGQLLIK